LSLFVCSFPTVFPDTYSVAPSPRHPTRSLRNPQFTQSQPFVPRESTWKRQNRGQRARTDAYLCCVALRNHRRPKDSKRGESAAVRGQTACAADLHLCMALLYLHRLGWQCNRQATLWLLPYSDQL